MSSKQKQSNQNQKKQSPIAEKPSIQPKNNLLLPVKDMLDNFDSFFARKAKLFYIISLALTVLLAGLLFDVKVGNGGDDSGYILRAYQFIHHFVYPSYQGPLYPFVLGPFILVFGINLPLLKLLSLVSLLVSILFFYKAFNKRIPGFILAATLLLSSINYFVLFYASQTYSEAFFMMLQSIFIWFFATRFLENDSKKKLWPEYGTLGLLLFLMVITKNIAFAAVMAIGGFFLISRRWKDLLYTSGIFVSLYGAFEILKRLLWGNTNMQFASQGSGLMYKNFYNPSQGKEDFAGFIQRFFDNSNLYFSKHLFEFLGFRPEYAEGVSPFLTIIVYAIFIVAVVYGFRKNKLLFFVGVYVLTMCAVEFFAIQAHWDQWRLIVIFYPLFLLMILSAMYSIFKQSQLKGLQFIIPVFLVIIFFLSFSVTSNHIKMQRPILERNLKGNLLYGLTPDWINYIQMSNWAAKNIPKDLKIASRKPEISFIYSERVYTGITKVPNIPLDTFLGRIKSDSFVYMAVSLMKISESKQMLDRMLMSKLYAIVSGNFNFTASENDNMVCVYKLTKPEFETWSARIKEENIQMEPNIEPFLKQLSQSKTEYIITSPDELLDNLKKSEIRYVLLGSIRMNPNENSGNIINTLHRYLYYIQLKYPTVFKEVYKIGTDEVASLIEVNYKK